MADYCFLHSAGVYEVSPSKNFYYLRWVAQLISRWISPRVQLASLAFIVMAATKRLWVCQNKIHWVWILLQNQNIEECITCTSLQVQQFEINHHSLRPHPFQAKQLTSIAYQIKQLLTTLRRTSLLAVAV